MELDDEAVVEIASEDDVSRQQRLELRATRRTLEAGDRLCRKYMARRDLKLDTPPQPTRISSSSSRPQPGRRRNVEEVNATPKPSYIDESREPQRYDSISSRPTRNSAERTFTPAPVVETPQMPNDSYNPPTHQGSRYSAVPNYGRYDPSAEGGYDGANIPPPPPRPAGNPPIPPKRPDGDDANSEHARSKSGLFGRRKN